MRPTYRGVPTPILTTEDVGLPMAPTRSPEAREEYYLPYEPNALMSPAGIGGALYPYPEQFYDPGYGMPPHEDWGSPTEMRSDPPVGLNESGVLLASNAVSPALQQVVQALLMRGRR